MNNKRLFLSPPHMGLFEQQYVKDAFESNYIAPLGPQVDAFEREFVEYVGIKHCVALSSGTAAMHLALRILGVGQASPDKNGHRFAGKRQRSEGRGRRSEGLYTIVFF